MDIDDLLRDPDDVDARLVYADLLTRAGDPRGELIVVQHRLGQGENRVLRARERELIVDHAPSGVATELGWQLGFVDGAVLGTTTEQGVLRAIPESIDALLRHPSCALLRRLWLRYGPIKEWVRRMPFFGDRLALQQLQIGDDDSGDDVGDVGGLWSRCPNLQAVRLVGGAVVLGERPAFFELRSFELDVPGLPSGQLAVLADAYWPKLEHLYIDVSAAGVEHDITRGELRRFIASLVDGAERLATLQLVGAFDLRTLCAALAAHPKLLARIETLDVSTHCDADAAAAVASLRGLLPNLRALVARGGGGEYARQLREAFRDNGCEVIAD